MNFENPNIPKNVTSEQLNILTNTFGEDMESEGFQSLLHELGIEIDSGFVDIVVDGTTMKMNTSREDFGTILEE